MRIIFGLAAATLALTACEQAAPAGDKAAEPAAEATATPAEIAKAPIVYTCPDGSTVEATYPTTDTARITHKDQTIDMQIAKSASGARYTGGGWEWWTKGMTKGTLSPLAEGEDIASAAGMICTV